MACTGCILRSVSRASRSTQSQAMLRQCITWQSTSRPQVPWCGQHRILHPLAVRTTGAPLNRSFQCSATSFKADEDGRMGTLGGREIVSAAHIDPQEYYVKQIGKDDVTATFSRSSGAGGQNVNKVSTKASIRFDVVKCNWMSQALKQALMQREAGRMTNEGELIIASQTTRSQADNLEDAMQRLQEILNRAADSIKPIQSDPKKVQELQKRKRKADVKRLDGKKKQKDKKAGRKKVTRSDW